jgi:hypothetical protein
MPPSVVKAGSVPLIWNVTIAVVGSAVMVTGVLPLLPPAVAVTVTVPAVALVRVTVTMPLELVVPDAALSVPPGAENETDTLESAVPA